MSIALADLERCFEGVVPAVVATASATGVPNVTYLSRVRRVDAERVAISNQFFSKTSRNVAENPRASLLVIDPETYDEFRLTLVFERTERRGRVFERLREDVDVVAALEGMQDVFTLRAADIYRVVHVEQVLSAVDGDGGVPAPVRVTAPGPALGALGELSARLSRCSDLDALVGAAVDGLAELLGWEHSAIFLLDEDGDHLFTIASHGYADEGVGAEVPVGEGAVGMAAARCRSIRLGNLRQMAKYSRSIRRSFEARGEIGPGWEIPVPGLPEAESRLAVPARCAGQLVGVVVVESAEPAAFDERDQAALEVVATLVASAVESERLRARGDAVAATGAGSAAAPPPSAPPTRVRFFAVDGSTFLDGDYLVKGVAGRMLWSLLGQHEREGRVDFTNREVRLDPLLELPAYRDNFESRLILLKRRLDEREAPIRIEKTGRGRFRLVVGNPLVLEAMG